MRAGNIIVAVVGANGTVGRELVDVLNERQLPLAECRRIDRVSLTDPDDQNWDTDVQDVADADFEDVDLVFMCANAEATRTLTPQAVQAGARVIDLTQAFTDDGTATLIVPEVNAHLIGERRDLDVIASPTPGAVALSVVLKPLEEAATLQRVVVAGYVSVSSAGRAGIEELSRQTVDLLNGRSIETAVFPQRVAFNLVPQVGEAFADGVAAADRRIEQQTRQILDLLELPIVVTSVIVPTFYGSGFVVNVQTEAPLTAADAREALRTAPGVLLIDEPQTNAFPTLVDCVGQDATLVGRIRDDGSVAHGVSLWVVMDAVRKGAAANAVQIAELLMRHTA